MPLTPRLTIFSNRTVPPGTKPKYQVQGACEPDPFDTLMAARLYGLREFKKYIGGHFPPFSPTHVIVHPKRRINVRVIKDACFTEDEWQRCAQAEWEYNPKDGRMYFQGLRMIPRWTLKPFILFRSAFAQPFVGNQTGWAGHTLILRIEPAALMASGSNIRLTLHASTMSTAHVDRIYVSQPDTSPGANPYDAAEDLTKIWDDPLPSELIVSAAAEQFVPEMPYRLDRRRPLLIAIEFSVAAASGIAYARNVSPARATSFYRLGAEASQRKRSNDYTSDAANQRYHFVGLVETGDVVRAR